VSDSPNLGRASTLLAAGTALSRVLGFASAIVLAQTIGSRTDGADAFALATQLPNNIYALIAGGLLSAVFVPAIVRAGLNADGGQAFVNKLVTLGLLVFTAAGVIATLAAPALVRLYAFAGESENGGFLDLATTFAYWCLPQVLFYALYSLFGEVLNARNVFGPFTWAPAINNVIVIVGLVVFAAIFGSEAGLGDAETWTPGMVALIGGASSLGVAMQAFLLCFFWRRAGLRYRPDFRFRGVGLGTAGKAAAWTFGAILATQLAGLVQSNVVGIAAKAGGEAAFAITRYTWLIFMLPHSIAAVSIATAYFTRMSTHARDGRLDELRSDLSASVRSIGLIIVFASVGLIVLAYPFSAVFSKTWDDVTAMAPVLVAFLIGLVPFSILHVVRRAFYAIGEMRTPFFVTVFQAVLFVAGAVLVGFLPPSRIVLGIAVVTTVAGVAQTALSIVLLRRRIGPLGGGLVLRRHVQFLVASVPAAVAGSVVVALCGGFAEGGFGSSSPFGGIVTMVIAGVIMVGVYAGGLTLMHNPEYAALTGPVVRRIRRR
jgi:putative peptidoglycan lipid II flippase